MKKVIFSLALFLTCSLLGYAQKGISYQAVILDPKPIEIPGQDITGQPFVNGAVSLKFKIFSATFVQEFEEVHTTQTDAYGLVNVLIGSVSPGVFSSLVWDSNPKNMQVWVSFDQGGSYTKVSEQVLTYNPYAIYAETAGKLGGTLGIAAGGTGATTAAGARTNLGLGNVDNTSDANKPISIATQAALDTKANASDVTTSLATKANASEVNASLATKANAEEVATAVATKANSAEVTTALATKANASDVSASLALKEDVSNKANTPLGSSTTLYPTQSAVKTYVDAQVAAATLADANGSTKGKIQLAGDLGGTAAAPTVPGLALKANASEVTAALAVKADTAYVLTKVAAATIADASSSTKGKIQLAGDLGGTAAAPAVPGLALKANTTDVNTSLALKAPIASPSFTGTVSGITKSMVGLGSVDNTTDAAKPISTATQAALDQKANAADLTSLTTSVNANTASITATAADLATLTTTVNANTASITANTSDILLKANTTDVTTALALKAPLESPALSGVPTAPTASAGTNSTQIATTAFVASAVSTLSGNSGVPYAGATGAVNLGAYDLQVNGLTIGKGNGSTLNNTAIGLGALTSNTQGSDNTSNGYNSLKKNTVGFANSAFGSVSLFNNLEGGYNSSFGSSSLYYNTGGTYNSSFGSQALYRNTTGNENTATGFNALSNNTVGSYNSAIGVYALANNTLGQENTANGVGSLNGNTEGNKNTAIGRGSLSTNTLGNSNTAIGFNADVETNSLENATAVGNGAKVAESNTIQLGNSAVTNVNTSGAVTVDGIRISKGGYVDSNQQYVGRHYTSTAVGVEALITNDGGYANTAIGFSALKNNVNGSSNSAFGAEALRDNTDGARNTAIGNSALLFNSTGSFNTVIGGFAAQSLLGSNNTAVGDQALYNQTVGDGNTAIGGQSGESSENSTYGTFLGYMTRQEYGKTLTNATAIGYNAEVTTSNTIQLGNSDVTNVKTSGSITTGLIKIGQGGSEQNGQYVGKDDLSTAVGFEALINNNGGYTNTAFGYTALKNNVIGGDNSAFGPEALLNNTEGESNTAIGRGTLIQNSIGSYNTAVGKEALNSLTTGDANTAIGYRAGEGSENSSGGTFLGYKARQQGGQTLANATAIGYKAEVTASNTIQLGNDYVTNVNTSRAITVDGIRISRGGYVDSNQQYVGRNGWSTAVGYEALISNNGGYNNTAIGYTALRNNVTGNANAAFGDEALRDNSGNGNTAIGHATLVLNTSGAYNTAVGTDAAYYNLTGIGNTAIGANASQSLNIGDFNTALGYKANVSNGLSNATAIGYEAEVTASNTIQLGNNSITKVNTNGTVWSDGLQLSSDLRLKTNIQPLLNSIDLIMQLNPVHYNKKNSIESSDYAKTENGFIAQELQKVLPYLVSAGTDQDKILSVDYNSIIPVLTKGIQEHQVLIEAQQKQIDELKLILEKLLNEKK